MSTLTMAAIIYMALFCCLLGPTLGLSNLKGLNSERTRRGLLGTGGGFLGGVLGGGDKDSGGGPLGGLLGGGDKGVLGGVLGGDGGKGGGLLGGVGDLLTSTTNGVLSGTGGLLNGTLGQKKLVDLLTGPNGLLGLTDFLNLLGLGNEGLQDPFQWENILTIQYIRGSWKIVWGTELVLNLQSVIVLNLPTPLLRNVTVDVDTTLDLAILQDPSGDLKLVLKNCQKLVAGFTVNFPSGLLALMINNAVNSAIQNTLPAVLCPLLQEPIDLFNMELRMLNDVLFGALSEIHTALSKIPTSSGHFSLDLKDKPFPGYLLNWLFDWEKLLP